MSLSSKQIKAYRAQAHHLNPVVIIGQHGLTDAVIAEIDTALKAHGLIKIKAGAEASERQQWAEEICQALDAELIQMIGKVIIIFRPKPE